MIDEKFRKVKKMLDLLAEYFRDLIAKSIEIIEFNEAILSKDKFDQTTNQNQKNEEF